LIESLGAIVDLVIRKSPFPILLVRKPVFPPNEIVKSILLLVDSLETIRAAELALTLAKKDSNLKLLSIIEKETVETVEELAETLLDSKIDKDVLELVHKKEAQGIINGIVFEAEKKAVKVAKVHLVGDRIRLVLEEAKKKHTIIISATSIFQGKLLDMDVENLIRFCQIPVLIIKG